jgi:molybdopterin-guanine dinucleotide biosynthesis protein A
MSRGPQNLRAATLGAAAAAVDVVLDRRVVAVLDDGTGVERTGSDPGTPLVAGDSVAFLPVEGGRLR